MAAYRTAAPDKSGLINTNTPEKVTIVRLLLNAIRKKESAEAVNVRASSAMRWSGLASSPDDAKRQ